MDQLVLHSSWRSATDNNLTLTGLLIEGASFNGSNLTPCTSTSENIIVVPDCNIIWIDKVSLIEQKQLNY